MKDLMIHTWAGSASPSVQFPFFAEPWEAFAVELLAWEGVIYAGAAPRATHTCNSQNPDIMAMTGTGDRHMKGKVLHGTVISFPPAGGANPPHIDWHLEIDAAVAWAYTAYYRAKETA